MIASSYDFSMFSLLHSEGSWPVSIARLYDQLARTPKKPKCRARTKNHLIRKHSQARLSRRRPDITSEMSIVTWSWLETLTAANRPLNGIFKLEYSLRALSDNRTTTTSETKFRRISRVRLAGPKSSSCQKRSYSLEERRARRARRGGASKLGSH